MYKAYYYELRFSFINFLTKKIFLNYLILYEKNDGLLGQI